MAAFKPAVEARVYFGNARKPSMIKDETHHLEDYPVNEVEQTNPIPHAATPHSPASRERDKPACKKKPAAKRVLLTLRQRCAHDLSIYARPRFFQAVDIAVGIARRPTMVLQLLGNVWHRQGNVLGPFAVRIIGVGK
jgi:hypothetical protein